MIESKEEKQKSWYLPRRFTSTRFGLSTVEILERTRLTLFVPFNWTLSFRKVAIINSTNSCKLWETRQTLSRL